MAIWRFGGVCAVASMAALSGCALFHHGKPMPVGPPIEAQLTSDDTVVVKTNVTGDFEEAGSVLVGWRINGIEQQETETLSVSKTASASASLPVLVYEGENIIDAVLSKNGAEDDLRVFRLYGVQLTAHPPTIDGKFTGDWDDPPLVHIVPPRQQVYPEAAKWPIDPNEFQATARAWFSGDRLYLGLEVVDGTPFWNDVISLSLHTFKENNGTSMRVDYPLASLVRHVNDGVTAAEITDDGYTFETAIELPHEVKAGESMSFNLQIVNGDRRLVWSGDKPLGEEGLMDGMIVALPDPSTLAAGKRKQLFGGETKLEPSAVATKDKAALTPLPVEYPDSAAYLPEGFNLKFPAEGEWKITGGYGYENESWTHETIANLNSADDFFCIDIAMPEGTPILAAAGGRIVQSGRRGDSYGNYVVIDHGNGYQSIYAHLTSREFDVDKGQPEVFAKQGQLIGYSGQSGTSSPHLHFGLHKGARASHSGANVGGLAVVPEPLSGYYGLREEQVIVSDNRQVGTSGEE